MTAHAPTIQDLIDEYIRLRNWKEETEKKSEEHVKVHAGKRMKEIEGILHQHLNETGTRTAGIPGQGVAFFQTFVSCKTYDMEAWRNYVIEQGQWEMATIAPHKPSITQFVKKTGKNPPGVDWQATDVVRFRKDRANGTECD
jgi:hypothetical protein